ncbi:hypothetical protein Pla163_27490 [Planctomycetes bacterium Pla163]|uniref:Uncharacterized protein n=1 Tax=Rohdeia mirabilis TaxID=2528008 RepID=A0A518D2C8_9BACT|nr:hypothetical protein Pla163_27490 [Planctomycetes bacterium Pla163]
MRVRATVVLVPLCGVVLVTLGWLGGAGSERTARGGSSLVGPIAGVAASVQWVRAHHELRNGRDARGFALAETALALDPGATNGWSLLVDHQLRALGSHLREPDPDRRRAWIESALSTAERGLVAARDPARLAVDTAVGLWILAEADDVPTWPGGRAGLVAEARAWFERARDLGSPAAADFLRLVDEEAVSGAADGVEPHPGPGG